MSYPLWRQHDLVELRARKVPSCLQILCIYLNKSHRLVQFDKPSSTSNTSHRKRIRDLGGSFGLYAPGALERHVKSEFVAKFTHLLLYYQPLRYRDIFSHNEGIYGHLSRPWAFSYKATEFFLSWRDHRREQRNFDEPHTSRPNRVVEVWPHK